MNISRAPRTRRLLLFIAAAACVALATGCGSGSDESTVISAEPTAAAAQTPADDGPDADLDADHSDEDDPDHADDEDHSDEDADHSDDEDDHNEDDHSDEDAGHDDDEDHDNEDADHDDDHDDHDDDHSDDDDASGGLDAHVHGSAELFVAWSGTDVVVDLISPANNVFGFEYEPSTDEDLAIVTERTEVLTAPNLLVFNEQAACSLAADADSEFTVEGSHAEVVTSWLFTCTEIDELTQLDLTALFAEFPRFEDIDVQWASENRQSAAELSPSSAILQFD